MIHPSPSSLRVLPIARMMHHDLVIRAMHRAGCCHVLPHARADDSMYVSLKCAVYLDRRWGSWLLFRHSMHATLELAVRTHCIYIVFCERSARPQANGGAIALQQSTANINNCKFDGSTAVGCRKSLRAHSHSACYDVRESRFTHLRPYSESCPMHA